MASQSDPASETVERLVLHKRPDATLRLLDTQLPLLPDGVTVERFSTRHGKMFELHTDSSGIETWYKVQCAAK